MYQRPNTLIMPSDDCDTPVAVVPAGKNKKNPIPVDWYQNLIKCPHKYTEREFRELVYFTIRGDMTNKIDEYDSRRSLLCRKYGWGIHFDGSGRMALLGRESKEFKTLSADPLVTKVRAFNAKRA
jgi:hypothetical protein